MTAAVERIRKEASQLPDDEREALVRVLEHDLDVTPPSKEDPAAVDAEWDALIRDRVSAIEEGAVKLIPLDEVEAEMDAFVAGLSKA